MIKHLSVLITLFWAVLLLGCGSGIEGASEDDALPTQSKPIVASGVWSVENVGSETDCVVNPFSNRASLTVTQEGNSITVRDGNGSFVGGVTDKDMAWSGQFIDKTSGKFITLYARKLAVSGNSFSGEVQWRQRALISGVVECSGKIQYTGAKIANTVPAKPAEFTAAALSDQTIALNWKDAAIDEVGVIVERADSEKGEYLQIAKLAANTTHYRNTSLPAETAFFYRIRNYNNAGVSENSAVATATTQSHAAIAPLAPQNLKVALTDDGAKLNWDDKANNENHFIVSRSLEESTSFEALASVDVDQTTYTDSSGLAGTQYFYFVRSANAFQSSDASNTVSITFPAASTTVPTKPAGLTGNALTESSIKLRWQDAANDEDGFIVERSAEGPASKFDVVAMLPKNSNGYVDQKLEILKTYFYRVRAFNLNGDSENTDAISVQTKAKPATAPVAPSNLSAIGIASNAIALAWENAPGNSESGFELERSLNDTADFVSVAEPLAGGSLAYTDQELPPTTTFFYRLRAVNSVGESSYTNVASAKTLETAPEAPSKLLATPLGQSALKISWQDNANNESHFLVERSATSEGVFDPIAELDANTTEYTDNNSGSGYTPDTHYYYRVRASNSIGKSAYSNVIEGFTLKALPLAPTNLAVNTGATTSNSISVSWEFADQNTADGFRLYFSKDEFSSESQTQVLNDPAQRSTVLAGLSPGVKYSFRMHAFNNGGNSNGFSNQVSETTLKTIPIAPSAVTVATLPALTQKTLKISWADNSNNGNGFNEDGFRLYRSTTATNLVQQSDLIFTTASNAVTYIDSTLPNVDTVYYYAVVAFNNGGDSAAAQGNGRTLKAVPVAPSNLVAFGRNNPKSDISSLSLSWDAPSSGADGYKIYTFDPKTGKWNLLVYTIPFGTNTQDVGGLIADTVYQYRVVAYNNGGDSASVSGTFKTPPYTLTVDPQSVIAGSTLSVTSDVGGIVCNLTKPVACTSSVFNSPTTVTLSAAFTSPLLARVVWTGCDRPSGNTCVMDVFSDNRTVTAKLVLNIFILDPPILNPLPVFP